MTSYEISHKLEELGFDQPNTNETISIMNLMRGAKLFGISFSFEDAAKGVLYGHVGHYNVRQGLQLWFINRSLEEMKDRKGSIEYSLIIDGVQFSPRIID